jgi:hypothetical protein
LFSRTPLTDLSKIGHALEDLFKLRSKADYETTIVGPFYTYFVVDRAADYAEQIIDLQDEIESDAAKKSAAVAAVLAVP